MPSYRPRYVASGVDDSWKSTATVYDRERTQVVAWRVGPLAFWRADRKARRLNRGRRH